MSATAPRPRRRFFAPEVVQTSGMDCGPAALGCLLAGFGIQASYGRLREACQTDVDGTSIDTLDDIARSLGLDAEQTMLPVDHLLIAEAEALPAIVVVRLPNGFTHFVVVWRRVGPFVQLMDPAVGRRWVRVERFLDEVYVHSQRLPANAWRDWASTDGFIAPLRKRLSDLDCEREGTGWIENARADPTWRGLSKLDAAIRLGAALVRSGAVRRGREARGVIEGLLQDAEKRTAIPERFFCVSDEAAPGESAPDEGEIILRGAVLLRVHGKLSETETASAPAERDLAHALAEPAPRPFRDLYRLARDGGHLGFAGIATAIALAAAGTALEALLFRGFLELGRKLGAVTERIGIALALVSFSALLLAVELGVVSRLVRTGRRLECRLRAAFLAKLPRLSDRYFHSRPVSDMAERSHAIHTVRELPRLVGGLIGAGAGLVVTALAISWLDPASAPLALIGAGAAIALPALFRPVLEERDLRLRTHSGTLKRFAYDALRGLSAVRAHGAERSIAREQEGLLLDQARTGRSVLRAVLGLELSQALIGYGFAFAIVFLHVLRTSELAGALLLAYWSLQLPILGSELAGLARQLPIHRNRSLRLLEPLGAREGERHDAVDAAPRLVSMNAAAIRLGGVRVVAAGHTILDGIDLDIAPGAHVAIVGRSGSGKSSLLGLLLGWHEAAAGEITVDGEPLDARRLEALRDESVWIDPAVQLWNRSLVANITYGSESRQIPSSGKTDHETAPTGGIGDILESAELYSVVERLPDGLQSRLGEGGGLISGGEGQRVRLARGLHRDRVRLALLDEAFRGLDRAARRRLLGRMRRRFARATFLCVTHDVEETLEFERVLVLEEGRIVEDGAPRALALDPASRYRSLLDAEREVRTGLWSAASWRHVRLETGTLDEIVARGGTDAEESAR
jgi:ABC-type bacteriocin/lantibiotic exporter with double-glycine peptidase domain